MGYINPLGVFVTELDPPEFEDKSEKSSGIASTIYAYSHSTLYLLVEHCGIVLAHIVIALLHLLNYLMLTFLGAKEFGTID